MIPRHVAIIPDGNRRWAKSKGLSIKEGHEKGFDAVVKFAEKLYEQGVEIITVWFFSTDNWKRSEEEIRNLFILENKCIKDITPKLVEKDIKTVWAGRRDRIPDFFKKTLEETETKTQGDKKLYLAIDYGGKDEIIRAIKKGDFPNSLDIKEDVDLIVRTSSERRTSGFLIWQSYHSELCFLNKHCPSLLEKDAYFVLNEFNERCRRYGK